MEGFKKVDLGIDDNGKLVVSVRGEYQERLSSFVGESTFDGCRYGMNLNGNDSAVVTNANFANYLNNLGPFYDTGSPSYGGTFDENGFNDGYLHAPKDGYYRITLSVRVDFSGSDAEYVRWTITSPDRDNEWDQNDTLNVTPDSTDGQGAGSITITHWLSAGDRIGTGSFQNASGSDTRPHATASLQIEFVGMGTNPVL